MQSNLDRIKLPDHVIRNRTAWNKWAKQFVESGRRLRKQAELTWGIWNTPETELNLLPDRLDGLDAIELGCGTAYVSAWLARRGAHVTGIDNSEKQLKTARELQREHDLHFKLFHGNAEHVPASDSSFDLVISEYGASTWCDPDSWIPEASRLLRPGGQLIFVINSPILFLCMNDDEHIPASSHLLRDYFGVHRFQFPDGGGSVEFHLGYGDWIQLLRRNDFAIENLIEIRPPEGATTEWPFVRLDWARKWPSEVVWIARKTPDAEI